MCDHSKESNRHPWSCGTAAHMSRRTLLKAAGFSGLAWLTPAAELLADQDPKSRNGRPAQSVIILWLGGGPSQLETFDPHAGRKIAGGTTAIKTASRQIELAAGLPRLAEQMQDVSIIRNVVTREGDHERAAYNVKTGYRPDPTLRHPSLGATACHMLQPGKTEIPRHISILPDNWYGRGGYLGQQYDAFRTSTTNGRLRDMKARVNEERAKSRLEDIDIVEQSFRKGRLKNLDSTRTLHSDTISRAVTMMSSEQLSAFDVSNEPKELISKFGNSDFGRACLAAVKLIETGVRCVEVTLDGWDTHLNNHEIIGRLNNSLDAAFAALISELKARDRLKDTIVMCGGEFGRTPTINPAAGRDHWPHGFSIALAGGGIAGGQVIGMTDPDGGPVKQDQGTPIADVHATVLKSLGITPDLEVDTSIGRPMKLSEGTPIAKLLA